MHSGPQSWRPATNAMTKPNRNVPVYNWSDKPANLETKTTLAREGLRLAKGQLPKGKARGRYDFYYLYDRNEAVAKRPVTSQAQKDVLAAGRAKGLAARTCRWCGQVKQHKAYLNEDGHCEDCEFAVWLNKRHKEAAAWFKDLAGRDDWLILDTETTGLDESDEIVQAAVVDAAGQVLLDSLVKPTQPIPYGATCIHGITDEMVAGAPSFAAVYPELVQLITGRFVVAFNAEFDARMVKQSCALYNLAEPEADWRCAMRMYAQYETNWSDYWEDFKFISLADACYGNDIPLGTTHQAAADARLTWQLIQKIGRKEKEKA